MPDPLEALRKQAEATLDDARQVAQKAGVGTGPVTMAKAAGNGHSPATARHFARGAQRRRWLDR
jgi:hypothetical protein